MKTKTAIITALLAGTVMSVQAHESEHKLEYPGYRPQTEQAAAFIQNMGSSKIVICPSILRAVKPDEGKVRQWRSWVALRRIERFLEENELGSAAVVNIKFTIDETPEGGGQFAVFNQTIESIGKQLGSYTGDADYVLVLDIIRVRMKAWGLHCYILDREGNNAFSFLLNSHHKPFVDAAIKLQDYSKESNRKFITECTELLLEMLHQQVRMEKGIAAYKPDPAIAGKYIGPEDPALNYLILKPNGACEMADDGHHGTGTYAVVGGNTLILIMDGQRLPVGWFEEGKLIRNDGCTVTRVPLNSVQPTITGHWEGELIGDGDQPVRVTLDLDKNANSEWIASMGLPEKNMTDLVVQDVTVGSNSVTFVAVELGMTSFDLILDSEGTLKGTTSGRAAQSVEFRRTGEAKVKLITACPAVSEQLEGVWKGTLQTPHCGVPMTFQFKNQPDNTVLATVSTEHDEDLPLNDVKQTGQKVEFGMKIAQSSFEGTLNEKGTELDGVLTTGGGPLPLTLRKAQLQLYRKRIIIYPILAGNPADDDDAWRGAVSMAEHLGVQLERQGMHPSVAPKYSEPLVSEKNLAEVAKQVQPPRGSRATDYILFARFEGKQTDDEFVCRARAVMVDATGRIVWSQDPSEYSKGGNIWPIMLYQKLGQTLCAASDLQEAKGTSEPGPFEEEMREKMMRK